MALEEARTPKTPPAPPAIVTEIVKKWDEASVKHRPFVRAYERNERAYRGVLNRASDAARWNHSLHPPYAFNLIETIVSNTVEMGLRFDVRPSPKHNLPLEEATQMLAQTEAVSDLLRHEHRVDDMDAKQRPLFLSASICGMGVGKPGWAFTEGSVRRQGVKMERIEDDDGNLLLEVPVITEVETHDVIRDHSTFEVVDPRDFVMHESAKALQPLEPGGAQYVFHRQWMSMEQLRLLEKDGLFKGVDYLSPSQSFEDEYDDREKELWEMTRTKDLVEVLEYWCFKRGRVHRAYVGNRTVLLRDIEPSPFWHNEYPFVISSSMPQLFSPRGASDMELIEQLQEIIWELLNQRLDNIELINNAIFLLRSDIEDPDAFEFYPGARWQVDSTDQVEALQPPYQLATVSLEAEALLRGDLQNVTSAAPFTSGAESAAFDQKTATGVSIVMNAAQQRLIAKKYQAQQGLRHEANMRIKNCQQFITDRRLVHILGMDGALTFRQIDPLQIQGEFMAELTAMGDSQMRQEKRAERTQLMQLLLQAAPIAAAVGAPLNIKEILSWTLEGWGGIEDAERFFSAQPQPAMMGAPQGVGGQLGAGPPSPPSGPNLGVTSETAVDASSPSATGGISMSPELMMQRTLAMRGGANNI